MALSNDLISQFVKVTKDKAEAKSETIVYGTVQESIAPNGLNYVKIDGSDLLTPVSSTTVISANDRVTILVKNHTAVVTGNLTSPAVRKGDAVDIVALNVQKKRIDDLEIEKLSASDIEGLFADIDLKNVSKANRWAFYAESGLIKDAVVDGSTITGSLAGVDIDGSLIKNNTIGASKINVDDLASFHATIGGLNITNSSIYSETKSRPTNISRGIYLGKDSQAVIGDSDRYVKYYRNADNTYKLTISADDIAVSSIVKIDANGVSKPLCGKDSEGRYIFGNNEDTMYYYAKNVNETVNGIGFVFTSGNFGSGSVTDTAWLFGSADSTSRYIGSYLTYNRTYTTAANMVVTGDGIFGRNSSSSRRYKRDIVSANIDELKGLYDLPIKKFKYKNDYIASDDELYNTYLYGFIVEDLENILPCAVQHKKGDDGKLIPEMWNCNIIVPSLLKLIQDLNDRLIKIEMEKP